MTVPGTSGTANVRGKAGVRVFRTANQDPGKPEGDVEHWCSAVAVVGKWWHADMDINDFVEDGSEK